MCLYITIYAEICKQKSLAVLWQKKKESLPFGKDSQTVDNTPETNQNCFSETL